MNYLAHAYLSCSDEDLLLGNLMTDFMRKSEEKNYQGRVLEGIQVHREIDSFTDKHPASLELRNMLRKRHDKYSSVVVDLIWDYYLCLHWSDYSGRNLTLFVTEIYELLLRRRTELPHRFESRLDNMIEADFLLSYSSLDRMRSALEWMDNRVKYQSNFVGAIDDVKEHGEVFDGLFRSFFPDLIELVDGLCNC